MKIRSLHPSFFSDAKVCSISPQARILFAGLWCYADDYGRGQWLPKSIEGAVFPRDVVDIQSLLNEVLRAGLVRVFTDGSDDFYEIPTWNEYQSPRYQAKTSIPDPESLENPYVTDPGQFRADSAQTLYEVSPEFLSGEGEGEGVERRGSIAQIQKPARTRNDVWDTLSDIFGEPETKTARSLRGKVSKSLTEAGATPDEMYRRAQNWPLLYPDATLTDIAFEKHWTALGRPPLKASKGQVREFERDRERESRLAAAREMDERKALEA